MSGPRSRPRRPSKAPESTGSRSSTPASEPPVGAPVKVLEPAALRELYLFMRLAREWDLRFEKLFKTGALSKWYSSVGNEGVTVPVASALETGDVLCSLHRDSGAILRYYLDASQIFQKFLGRFELKGMRWPSTADSKHLLYRLACQMLGKAEGFSGGYERSYHYGLFQEDDGIAHIGMISHLGSMIPVAAGAALALKHKGTDRVAVNFIGEGGTSTGDFHEGLNMAATLKLPFILIIENNRFAFSTPTDEQYACDELASRGAGYGIPGIRIDGNKPEEVTGVIQDAIRRARRGEGPTLIEAMVGRMRGHSEGDDSLAQVPPSDLRRYQAEDPVTTFERSLIQRRLITDDDIKEVTEACSTLVLEAVDRALEADDPDPTEERPIYAD